jgi:DNA-binding LacI/PurR family transcriptional regulator
VPDDVAVIGFGGSEITAYLNPPLSTVSIENRAMGCRAVRLLLDRIAPSGGSSGGSGLGAVAPTLVRTEPRLIVRASTVPAGLAAPAPANAPVSLSLTPE